MTPGTDELNNPPFDPTPLTEGDFTPIKEGHFFIKVRSPEVGQNLDENAWMQGLPPCQSASYLVLDADGIPTEEYIKQSSLFGGPSKSELRTLLLELCASYRDVWKTCTRRGEEQWSLRKQVTALQKQCLVYEKTHEEMDSKMRILQMSLVSANEEIERLVMGPKKNKPVSWATVKKEMLKPKSKGKRK